MAEIYGVTTLDNKLAIQSAGDVRAVVHGRRCVVSALGFEHKSVGHDTRLLAKALDEGEATPNTPDAPAETQARINLVRWPAWPDAETALSPQVAAHFERGSSCGLDQS